ncbi:MAG: helix-turn-helix transcriptional regulator [Bacteroides sp.]|nr:helix-turn-helix transcriptional regulator [Bacteroides sp.]
MRTSYGDLEELAWLADVVKYKPGTPEHDEALKEFQAKCAAKRAGDTTAEESHDNKEASSGEVSGISDTENQRESHENDLSLHHNQPKHNIIHNMREYHLGEEINKEMRRQGMTLSDFARALHRERPTVYNIFKKRHIATDTLAKICRVLNRDFFKELSQVNFNYQEMAEEDDSPDLKEAVSALMPEDELHSVPDNYMLYDIVEEFLLSDREKPLVIFYTPLLPGERKPTLQTRIERLALSLWGQEDKKHVCELRQWGPEDTDIYMSTCVVDEAKLKSYVLNDKHYRVAMGMAKRSALHEGCRTILYIPIENGTNKMRLGRTGGLVYDDIAEELFEAWKDEAHFVYAPALGPRLTRELYHAYRRTGVIDRLIERMTNGEDISMDLYYQIIAYDILEADEIKEADSTGLSRIKVYYTDCGTLSECQRKHLLENGVNDDPRLSMWIDIRNGYIVDFEYNKRTQPFTSKK